MQWKFRKIFFFLNTDCTIPPGIHEVEFLKQLSREFDHMTCTAIEPSSEGRKTEDALRTTDETKNVKFSWRQEKLEDYRRGCHGDKYHVISAIHCFYYLDDMESNLGYLMSSIEKGGILIIVHCTGMQYLY